MVAPATLAIALLLGAIGLVQPAEGSGFVEPVVLPGASPTRDAREIQQMVLARLGPEGEIDSVTVSPSLASLATVEPTLGVPEGPEAAQLRTIWLIRAHGRFVANRTPPGVEPASSPFGYYLVDDAVGEVIGMGWSK